MQRKSCTVSGNINPGRPSAAFEDDLKKHKQSYSMSKGLIDSKFNYYYGPYLKNK